MKNDKNRNRNRAEIIKQFEMDTYYAFIKELLKLRFPNKTACPDDNKLYFHFSRESTQLSKKELDKVF